MTKKRPNPDHRWSVYLLREKARFVGYVHAPDSETAIEKAIEELEIPPNLMG